MLGSGAGVWAKMTTKRGGLGDKDVVNTVGFKPFAEWINKDSRKTEAEVLSRWLSLPAVERNAFEYV